MPVILNISSTAIATSQQLVQPYALQTNESYFSDSNSIKSDIRYGNKGI